MASEHTSPGATIAANPAAALLRAGQPEQALQALTARVRAAPADASERLFLFQLLAVLGQWRRAGEQLQAAAQLAPAHLLLAATCEVLLRAEGERAAVFAGERLPNVLGAPEPWLAPLLQALQLEQQGQADAAASLRELALEQAPAVSGRIDEAAFAWLGDADARFGPCLELVTQSGYAWAPLSQLRELRIDAPTDLRDTVWLSAELVWTSGAQSVVFVPVRYPGSEHSGDPLLQLARRTQWDPIGHGLGQRMFATDAGEYPLLETRRIVFDAPA